MIAGELLAQVGFKLESEMCEISDPSFVYL
jgi:hypothetical protein